MKSFVSTESHLSSLGCLTHILGLGASDDMLRYFRHFIWVPLHSPLFSVALLLALLGAGSAAGGINLKACGGQRHLAWLCMDVSVDLSLPPWQERNNERGPDGCAGLGVACKFYFYYIGPQENRANQRWHQQLFAFWPVLEYTWGQQTIKAIDIDKERTMCPASSLPSKSGSMGIVSALKCTSFFQVSEGPPLRLWRATIEVPAMPEEILKRLLKEQHLWDVDLLDSKVIEILDSQTEIYQYVQNSMAPHPARDYVVLRWELPDWLLWQGRAYVSLNVIRW